MLKQGLLTLPLSHASTSSSPFPSPSPSLFLLGKPLPLPPAAIAAGPAQSGAVAGGGRGRRRQGRIICATEEAAVTAAGQSLASAAKRPVAVKAVVTVLPTVGGAFAHVGMTRGLDDIADLFGKTLHLELLSSELDPVTGLEKKAAAAFAHRASHAADLATYEASLSVPAGFGAIGAVLVRNEHHKEMYVRDIVLKTEGSEADGGDDSTVTFNCRCWVHSKFDNPRDRVFFASSKSYLPSETPSGLQRLRRTELDILRGDGNGERKKFDRIYDYDTYNDLGNPDKSPDLARPVLGGSKELPYPRRCRSGRPRSKKGI